MSYQQNFQDTALKLSLEYKSMAAAAELAASAVLHFKALGVEEEAFLSRLSRNSSEPRARELAIELAALHNRLARVFHTGGDNEDVRKLSAELDSKELDLGRFNHDYA